MLKLYAGRIGIPMQVYYELRRVLSFRNKVDPLLKTKKIMLYQIEDGTAAAALYLKMTDNPDQGFKIIGSGEAAAIALARQYDGILGSNNLRDILPYIQLFNLKHRTSADIMVEALEQHLISLGQGNVIWREMLHHNRKLPGESFTEYLKSRK
jgi:hypothetical protein